MRRDEMRLDEISESDHSNKPNRSVSLLSCPVLSAPMGRGWAATPRVPQVSVRAEKPPRPMVCGFWLSVVVLKTLAIRSKNSLRSNKICPPTARCLHLSVRTVLIQKMTRSIPVLTGYHPYSTRRVRDSVREQTWYTRTEKESNGSDWKTTSRTPAHQRYYCTGQQTQKRY